MQLQRTTTAGTAAAVALASTLIPELPDWTVIALKIVCAFALAVLGHSAAECPANCPGTDEYRRPKARDRQMPLPSFLLLVGCLIALPWLLSGCVSANPDAGKGTPPAPAYIVNPAVITWSNAAATITQDIGPLTGTGPLAQTAVAGGFAIAALVSSLIARKKSQTAAALASAVHAGGQPALTAAISATDSGKQATAVRVEVRKAALRKLVANQPT